MTTDYNPYILIEDAYFWKVMECMNLGKAMADTYCPHLSEDFERAIKQIHDHAESFIGSQNKPITKKAYSL